MDIRLKLDIQRQPDDSTCGPTCLKSIYSYYGDLLSLHEVIDGVDRLSNGGTLAVLMGIHALERGYSATLYTYDLRLFDPTWFSNPEIDLRTALIRQARAKQDGKLHEATHAYLRYLDLGGIIRYEDLTPGLIRRTLKRGVPILTGLSATYLYGNARERGWDDEEDPIRGTSAGHFVVLCGYEVKSQEVLVADPLRRHKRSRDRMYAVGIHRLIGAILLGVLSYDGNLLILEKSK
ncbi:C39 family peptidase [bacterium]|nr:C39 family peptidase [bacterium]